MRHGGLFEFRWTVARQGYTWRKARSVGEEGDAREEWWLTPGFPIGTRLRSRAYDPLADPVLFQRFAQTAPTREGILGFANDYGLLGHAKLLDVEVPESRRPAEPGRHLLGLYGEPVSLWAREILAVKEAANLYALVRRTDRAVLSRLIRWAPPTADDRNVAIVFENDPEVTGVPGRGGAVIAAPKYRRALFDRLSQGNLIGAANAYLLQRVNKGMEGRVSPRLLLDDEVAPLVFRVVPGSLIGALWLQLARGIAANTEWRRCARADCANLFEVSVNEGGSRSDRQYCGAACKQREWRRDRRRKGASGRQRDD